MSKPGVLIHIGYHKTATTYLQDCVFDGKQTNLEMPWHRHDVERWFTLVNPFEFDGELLRKEMQKGIDEVEAKGNAPVLSHEDLSGYFLAGGINSRANADYLKETFPDGKVLIMIREQKGMLKSMYRQYVRVGGPCSPKKFLAPTMRHMMPLFHPQHLEYDHLIRYYRKRFGEDRVLVLPFEQFRQDKLAAVDQICEFAGGRRHGDIEESPTNPALCALTVAIQRRFNFFFYRSSLNPAAPFHCACLRRCFHKFDLRIRYRFGKLFEKRLSKQINAYGKDRYRESNRRTSELLGIDLGELGYEV